MERIETTILRNLVFNEEYARKTIPFIQSDFFEERSEKIIFDEILKIKHICQSNKLKFIFNLSQADQEKGEYNSYEIK